MGRIDDLKARQRAVEDLHPDATGPAYLADRLEIMAPDEARRKREASRKSAAADGPREGLIDAFKARQRAEKATHRAAEHLTLVPAGPRPKGLHPYATSAVAGELARLDALPRPWAPGSYWDSTTFEVACNLVELANSGWSGYSLADAERDLFVRAPSDDRWGAREHRQKWDSARQKVGTTGRPEPGLMKTGQVFDVAAEDISGAAAIDAAAYTAVTPEEVERAARQLRVMEAARAKVAAEKAGPAEDFDAGTLADILARPSAPAFRVESLIPSEASCLLTAQRKTGKTTLTLNLARSLLTGEDFLGRFAVRSLTGNVAILNYEVSGSTLARWAADVGVPAERLFIVNLRGRRSPLAHPEDRERLAKVLREREVEALIVDPFGRAFTGKSQNDTSEVAPWLNDLDTFARSEAGSSDLFLTAHTGWEGERTRGSSALEDWPDSILTMTADGDDVRYLKALGRDVDLAETRLAYDPDSHRLSLTDQGSRKDARLAEVREKVLKYLADHPGASQRDVEDPGKGVGGRATDVRKALSLAIEQGQITRQQIGQKYAHYLADTPTAATASDRVPEGTDAPTANRVPRVYRDAVRGSGRVDAEDTPAVTASRDAVDECPGESDVRHREGMCACWRATAQEAAG